MVGLGKHYWVVNSTSNRLSHVIRVFLGERKYWVSVPASSARTRSVFFSRTAPYIVKWNPREPKPREATDRRSISCSVYIFPRPRSEREKNVKRFFFVVGSGKRSTCCVSRGSLLWEPANHSEFHFDHETIGLRKRSTIYAAAVSNFLPLS